MGNLLIAVLRGVFGLVIGIFMGIAEPFAQAASAAMTDIGQKVMSSLGMGIDSNVGYLLNSFINGFNIAMTWIKEFLGIEGSGGASQKFNEIGTGIVNGLLAGWNSLIGVVDAAILGFMDWVAGMFGTNKETLILTVFQLYTGIKLWWDTMVTDIMTIIGNLILDQARMWSDLKDNLLKIVGTLWEGFMGAQGWFTKIKADITTLITELVNTLTGNGGSFPVLKEKALQIIKDMWDGFVGASGWITKIKTDASKLIEDLKTGALKILGDFLDGIKQFGSDAWDNLLGKDGWITKLVGDLPKKFGEMIDGAKKKLSEFPDWLGNAASGFAKDVYDATLEVGDQLLQAIKDAIASGWEGLKNWFRNKFDSWFSNWWDSSQSDAENEGGDGGGEGGAAVGTNYAPGGRMWVGEDGPELLDLPRGSKITTNTKSALFFNDVARGMASRMDAVLAATTESMHRMQSRAEGQVGGRASQFVTNNQGTNSSQVNNKTTNERHDHWNLTIVSQATEESVVHNFDTMMAIAGANS
jgi:hypothetical protein